MFQRMATMALVLAGLGGPGLGLVGGAGEAARKGISLGDLSLQVAALEAIYQFELTPAQMETFRKIAPETIQKPRKRPSVKASDGYWKTLADLRDALVKAADEDLIANLQEKVEKFRDGEDLDLDDDVEITDAARKAASLVLRKLTARQIAAYVNSLDPVPDPLTLMLEALDKVRSVQKAKFKEFREESVEEIGWLLGGLDKAKVKGVREKVEEWLTNAHTAKEDDFRKQRPQFEKAARKFVSLVLPTQVLHNIAEHGLAELLANPQLPAALDARLNK